MSSAIQDLRRAISHLKKKDYIAAYGAINAAQHRVHPLMFHAQVEKRR